MKKIDFYLNTKLENSSFLDTLPKFKELLNTRKIQFKELPVDLMNTILCKFHNNSKTFEFITLFTFEEEVGIIENKLSNGETFFEEKEAVYTKDPYMTTKNELESIIGKEL